MGNPIRLQDQLHLVVGFQPQDINTPPTPEYVSLKNYDNWLVVVSVGVTGASTDISLLQATNVSGGSAKELIFTNAFTIANTAGADALADTMAAATVTNPGAAGAKIATGTNDNMLFVIPVNREMLDKNGGFDCIAVAVSDPGAITFMSALYIAGLSRYGGPPDAQASAVID